MAEDEELEGEEEVAGDAEVKVKEVSDHPTVDMLLKNDVLTMRLTISVHGTWKPEYHMQFLPLSIDRVDILQALLRDAQEEIAILREEVEGSTHLVKELKHRVRALEKEKSKYAPKSLVESLQTEVAALRSRHGR